MDKWVRHVAFTQLCRLRITSSVYKEHAPPPWALANTTARSTSSSSSGVALQDGVLCRFAAAAEMRPKSMDQAPPYSQGSTTITASPAAQMRLGTKHSTRVKQQVPFRLRWRSAYLAMARATAQPFPAGEEWNDWMKTVVPYQQRGHTSSIAVLPPSCASGGAESMLLCCFKR